MSRDIEFEQKIEILNQHLAVVQELAETLILKLNYDGVYPAASLYKEIDAISREAQRDKDASPDRRQLLTQIWMKLRDADTWTPPSSLPPGKAALLSFNPPGSSKAPVICFADPVSPCALPLQPCAA